MRILEEMDLSNIQIDRLPLNPRTLALVEFLRQGGQVPPIHVQPSYHYYAGAYQEKTGQFRILDGRHRFLAFKLLGRKKIMVRYGRENSEVQVPESSTPETNRWSSQE